MFPICINLIQIYCLLSCLHVRTVTSVCFDIGILYLAHGSIIMRGCVKYINDPDTTLTFDLKVKFIEFMTWPCVQASSFLSFNIVILCLARKCMYYHGTMCRIHLWTLNDSDLWPQYINYIFTIDLRLERYHRRNKFWHIDLRMTLTFDLYVVDGGVSLLSFTHSFIFLFILWWGSWYPDMILSDKRSL